MSSFGLSFWKRSKYEHKHSQKKKKYEHKQMQMAWSTSLLVLLFKFSFVLGFCEIVFGSWVCGVGGPPILLGRVVGSEFKHFEETKNIPLPLSFIYVGKNIWSNLSFFLHPWIVTLVIDLYKNIFIYFLIHTIKYDFSCNFPLLHFEEQIVIFWI